MSNNDISLDELYDKLNNLQKENISLKSQINFYIEKENLNKKSIERIKKIQNEIENNYSNSLLDLKNREKNIKNNYNKFKEILEKNLDENEKRLMNEINILKNQIIKRDEIILILKRNNSELNDKISKLETDIYYQKENYEKIILSKDRQLNELQKTIKYITKETQNKFNVINEQILNFKNMKNEENNNELYNMETERNNINENNNMEDYIKKLKNKIELLKNNLDEKNEEINLLKNMQNISNNNFYNNYVNNELISNDINNINNINPEQNNYENKEIESQKEFDNSINPQSQQNQINSLGDSYKNSFNNNNNENNN